MKLFSARWFSVISQFQTFDLVSDINECLESPCVHGSCSNLAGSFQCNCDAGWTGALCDNGIVSCCVSIAHF